MERDKALNEIAGNIRYWLRFDGECREREGLSIDGDNHITPPHWPTRRQLELWCHYLETPAQAIEARSGQTEGLDRNGESAVLEEDAP